MNETKHNPASEIVGLPVVAGSAPTEHPDHMGYAYATEPDADEVVGLFNTRGDAVNELMSEHPEGGWISAVRAVTEFDEHAIAEDWAFICYGEREIILPNNLVSNIGALPDARKTET